MRREHLEQQFGADRPRDAAEPAPPSAAHDAAVLAAARAAAARIRSRTRRGRRWRVPLAVAAGLAVGMAVPGLPWRRHAVDVVHGPAPALTVPAHEVTRGGRAASGVEIPVEKAPAEDWYRYIQELIYAGDTELAERHLHRFVELHPEYRPTR